MWAQEDVLAPTAAVHQEVLHYSVERKETERNAVEAHCYVTDSKRTVFQLTKAYVAESSWCI